MITIVYRACPYHNPLKAEPKGGKLELVRKCFNSLITAFEGVDYELTVLLDKPNHGFREIFKGYKVEELFTENFDGGNLATFHRQLDIALESGNNFFLFAEDDNYFLPGSGKVIVDTLKELPLITPYLHPAYFNEAVHDYKKEVVLVNGRCWIGVTSTTLTFAGRGEVLKQEAELMKTYGWADHPMFCDITQRIPLFAPTETLSTHAEAGYLAPGVDWSKYLP